VEILREQELKRATKKQLKVLRLNKPGGSNIFGKDLAVCRLAVTKTHLPQKNKSLILCRKNLYRSLQPIPYL
jgi:hypothetical protein